jgi:hypothetical protein
MRITFLLDVNPCSLVDRYYCFEGTCCLHRQRRESSVLLPTIGEELGNSCLRERYAEDGNCMFLRKFVTIS